MAYYYTNMISALIIMISAFYFWTVFCPSNPVLFVSAILLGFGLLIVSVIQSVRE